MDAEYRAPRAALPTSLNNQSQLGEVLCFRETQKANMLCHAGNTNENTNTISTIYGFMLNLKWSQVQCLLCALARSVLADILPGFFRVIKS